MVPPFEGLYGDGGNGGMSCLGGNTCILQDQRGSWLATMKVQ